LKITRSCEYKMRGIPFKVNVVSAVPSHFYSKILVTKPSSMDLEIFLSFESRDIRDHYADYSAIHITGVPAIIPAGCFALKHVNRIMH
jgi:hypothetical protein